MYQTNIQSFEVFWYISRIFEFPSSADGGECRLNHHYSSFVYKKTVVKPSY